MEIGISIYIYLHFYIGSISTSSFCSYYEAWQKNWNRNAFRFRFACETVSAAWAVHTVRNSLVDYVNGTTIPALHLQHLGRFGSIPGICSSSLILLVLFCCFMIPRWLIRSHCCGVHRWHWLWFLLHNTDIECRCRSSWFLKIVRTCRECGFWKTEISMKCRKLGYEIRSENFGKLRGSHLRFNLRFNLRSNIRWVSNSLSNVPARIGVAFGVPLPRLVVHGLPHSQVCEDSQQIPGRCRTTNGRTTPVYLHIGNSHTFYDS